MALSGALVDLVGTRWVFAGVAVLVGACALVLVRRNAIRALR